MSIKKLFDPTAKTRKYLTDKEQKEAFSEIESSKNLQELSLKQQTFTPQVDYSDPYDFAKFGSAYLYYRSAIERILDFYPYDGSDAELNAFYNKALPIEKYIFDQRYPRTNGYITFCAGGWGSRTGDMSSDGYGLPATVEYITFHGGPNIASELKTLKDMEPNPLSSKFQSNNIYDENLYDTAGLPSDYGKGTRESNLKSNFDTGVTVEFWLKTGSLGATETHKQVVFDMWNNEATSSADYGRITIELTGGAGSGNPILITAQSGTVSASAQMCFTSSLGQDLSSGDFSSWRHYAITMYNSGSDFKADLYVNGYLNDTNTYTGGNLGELNAKNMVGRLGALVASPSGSSAAATSGKLNGSLDEFRFWKVRRDGGQIGKYWFDQVRGGVNTDVSNTELGMYYKFNEGITGDTDVDSVVLDYGGRLCNGTWTGYTTTSRNTGSAILSASAATKEYEDPIIYADHPKVSNLKEVLMSTGSYHDSQNPGLVRNLLPSWISEDTEISEQGDMDKICHILGVYFDKLYLQINALPSFRHATYTSASADPLPFAQHLPQSLGLYSPEIFVDATILEKFKNRTDKEFFEDDLTHTKNLIYSNLYNNLAKIYKAKGTEKAIRNTLRCFNLDDSLVTYNVYSNNQQFELKNALKQTLKKKTFANFNTTDGVTAVIHQAADPHFASSRGYISGTNTTGHEDRHGFTVEGSMVFPKFYTSLDPFDRAFVDVSLFGLQTVNTASTADTAFLTGGQDVANFQVYAMRDAPYSKNAYFVLTSSTDPHNIPTLTSSLFFDVYDDSNWNISVRVKPSNYPFTDLVSSSQDYNYDVIFRGTNNNLGTVLNSFEVSSSVTKAVGQSILNAAKRMYVGARNTNITGTSIHQSDVLFSTAKYWTKYIDNMTLKQHLFDAENYGISGSYEHVSPLDGNTAKTKNYNTLALNWYFGNVTASDSAGNFYVTDLSSGSIAGRGIGWMGRVGGHLHTGKGAGFYTEATNVVKTKNVNEFKFVDPERAVASDMVQILNTDDQIFGLVEQIPNYVYTIEKSLYSAVSEEMLDFFAGAIDFHHLIGQPVNRYRGRYKALEHLRRVFFERVNDIKTVEKFTEYYKWFDDAISIIMGQLVPASADFVQDSFNTVESHVLERNKYKTQFPTIEFRAPDPEPAIEGVGAATWSWPSNTSPLPSSPRSTKIRQQYWQRRAETTSPEITSGDAGVDKQRQKFKEVIYAPPFVSRSYGTISNIEGVKYQRNQHLGAQRLGTYLFDATFNRNIKGGVNFDSTKNIGYTYNNLHPAGPVNAPSGGVYVPTNVLFANISDLVQLQKLELSGAYWRHRNKPNEKVKRVIKVMAGRDHREGLGYTTTKSTLAFPFNIVSSSVISGFNSGVVSRVTASIEITNLHNDVYGEDMERPMQTRFSEYAVGGHQSRHVGLNIYDTDKDDLYNGLDNYTTRPEAWKILLGDCGAGLTGSIGMVAPDYPWPEANERDIAPYPMTASQKAVYYRDFTAKTPYVFKNIRMRTGSTMRSNTTILGNYRNNYELVQTVGAWSNPRQFIELNGQPNLPAQMFQQRAVFATQARTFLDLHRYDGWFNDQGEPGPAHSGYTGSHFKFIDEYSLSYLTGTENKTVIKSRFSNPGSIESSYRDIRADEFSVYNVQGYSNMTVRKPQQGARGTITEKTGAGGPGIRVTDIHTMDYGLNSHWSRHTARFGRDSLIYTPDGIRESYDLNKPFMGYGDKNIYRSNASLQGWWRLRENISSVGSVDDSSGNGRTGTLTGSGVRPSYSTTYFPSVYIQTASCVFDANNDSVRIGASADWDALIGNDTAGGSSEKMSFSAWVYYGGPGESNYGRIVDFGAGDIMIYTDKSRRLFFKMNWDGSGVHWGTSDTCLTSGSISGSHTPVGGWDHVTVTYDATSTSNDALFYVNGNLVGSSVVSGSKTGTYSGVTTQDCFIGNNAQDNQCWEGAIAEFAVWNSIIDSEEVLALYQAARGPKETRDSLNQSGPGSYNSLKYPGFHKIHRNNVPKLRKIKHEFAYTPLNYNTGAVKNHIMTWYNTAGGAPGGNDLRLYNSGAVKQGQSSTTGSHWTLMAWFNYGNNPGNARALVHLGLDSTGTNGSALCWNLEGSNRGQQLVVTTANGAQKGSWNSTGLKIADDNWYHIAVTYNGDDTSNLPTFYVDGVATGLNVNKAPGDVMVSVNSVNGGHSMIGGGPAAGANLIPLKDAHLAEVAIYNAVLKSSEIAQIYNGGTLLNLTHSTIAPRVDNLITWLRMGDTKGVAGNDDLHDLSGSNTALSRSCVSGNEDEGKPHTVYDVRGNNHYALWGNPSTNSNEASSSFYSQTNTADPFFTGGYGGVYGNPIVTECIVYESSSLYDNAYVTHQIPRSDRQYAWITGAIHDPNNEFRFAGFMPTIGTDTGMYSDASTNGPQPFFNFASGSEAGSYGNGLDRVVGGSPTISKGITFIPQVSRLNLTLFELINSNDTIGAASGKYSDTFTANADNIDIRRNVNWGLSGQKGIIYSVSDHYIPTLLNQLLWKRYSQYGWGTFAQSRQSDHPVLYDQRKNNKMMIEYNTPGTQQEVDLRPVSLKGRPVTVNFDYDTTQVMRGQSITKTANATLQTSYNSEFIYFNSGAIDNHFDIPEALKGEITPFEQLISLKDKKGVTLNWVHYRECLFPSLKNEFSPTSSFRYGYDNKFWRDDQDERIKLHSTKIHSNSLGLSFRISASVWPLDAPKDFLTRTHAPRLAGSPAGAGPGGHTPYSPDISGIRSGGGYRTGSSYGGVYGVPDLGQITSGGVAGELQNTYGWYHETSSNAGEGQKRGWSNDPYPLGPGTHFGQVIAGLNPGALYARKHTMASPLSINSPSFPNFSASMSDGVLQFLGASNPSLYGHTTASLAAGEAFWDAPRTAGYLSASRNQIGERVMHFVSAASKPFYNDYDKFKEGDMKFLARGYSVVPEYRISERLEAYADGDTEDDFRDFEIPGTEFNSADEDFYIDFSNSDFMKNFLNVRHMSDLEATEIKLTCNAIIKFNPYKSFYPAQRTLDLVSQFSKSYGNAITVVNDSLTNIGEIALNSSSMGPVPAPIRFITQPLFAPGILYNSIKAGIACDWPVNNIAQKATVSIGRNVNRYSNFISQSVGLSGSIKYQDSTRPGTGDNEATNGVNYMLAPFKYPDVLSSVEQGYSFLGAPTGAAWFDQRLPFETIINPARFMAGNTYVEMEPHRLVQLSGTSASMTGLPSDNLYTRMASNFVAEVADFFLEDQNFTRLESKGVSLGKLTFPEGSVYGARLRLRTSYTGSRTYEYESSSHGNNNFFHKQGCVALYANASPVYHLSGDQKPSASFEIPQDPSKNPNFKRDFVMYSRATAFGPPITIYPTDVQTNYEMVFDLACTARIPSGTGISGSAFGVLSGDRNLASKLDDVLRVWNNNKEWYCSSSMSGVMDAMTGYNWAWTPPYYYGEAWADFIFRPDPDTEYSLERIVSEIKAQYWRVDPGPQTSSFATSNPLATTTASAEVLAGWTGINELIPAGGNMYNHFHFSALISDSPTLSSSQGGMPRFRNLSPYASQNINANAMQMSASLNLFGIENVYKKQFDRFGKEILTEREVVGKKWVIQPKFETPMMNFSDVNVTRPVVGEGTGSAKRTKTIPTVADTIYTPDVRKTVPGWGADTAANGMWHQFGTLPEKPNQGLFLEMGDIPSQWLRYHYMCVSESSIYNNFDPDSTGPVGKSNLDKKMLSLPDLLGFTDNNSKARLGELAKEKTIKEAVVAVPYILAPSPQALSFASHMSIPTSALVKQKQFINIPQSRIDAALSREEGTSTGDSFDTAGPSIRRLVHKMNDYVLPPQFDFLNRSVDPVVMYIFEFEYKLDKDDLSYIWQNLAPRNYERMEMQQEVQAHELFNTELLTEDNLLSNPNLRWMVFKVKQRSQKVYQQKVVPNLGTYTVDRIGLDDVEEDSDLAKLHRISSYNWPYDYLSIVELVKLEAEVLYRDDEIELDDLLIEDGFMTEFDYDAPSISGLTPFAVPAMPVLSQSPSAFTFEPSESLKVVKRKARRGDLDARKLLARKKKKAGKLKMKLGKKKMVLKKAPVIMPASKAPAKRKPSAGPPWGDTKTRKKKKSRNKKKQNALDKLFGGKGKKRGKKRGKRGRKGRGRRRR